MNSQKTSDESARLLATALAHLKAGRAGESEQLCRQVLGAEPRNSQALWLLGMAAYQQGQMEETRQYMEAALEIEPNNAQFHHDLGLAYCGLNDYGRAIPELRRAIELEPQFGEAYHNLGNAYHSAWYLDEAEQYYRRALSVNPELNEPRASLRYLEAKHASLEAVARRHRELLSGGASVPSAPSAGNGLLKIPARHMLPHLLNGLGLTGIGTEIGVQEGSFSRHVLRHWKGRLLYSVDPWREFSGAKYVDVANVSQAQQDRLYVETIQRLLPFGARSVLWRLTSREAASIIADGALDFCYVDADHCYEAVVEDIALWFPKVKRGGILAGHDYIPDGEYPFGRFGVQRAVHEFVARQHLELMLTEETQFPSWFVIKR